MTLTGKRISHYQILSKIGEGGIEVQGVAMSLAGIGLANIIFSSSSLRLVPPSPETQVALQLAGAVKAEWDRLGADIHVRFWDELLDRYLGAARRSLSKEDFEREWDQGREQAFDDAVKLALEIEVG